MSGYHRNDVHWLKSNAPVWEAVVGEIHGRRIRIGDHWLVDFASGNYLGFDLSEEIMDSIAGRVRQWGTYPSWARLSGTSLYIEIEERLGKLLHAPDTMVLPATAHIHSAMIPALAGTGTVFVDEHAHEAIYHGGRTSRAHGARLQRFRMDDLDDLTRRLAADSTGVRIVCVNGVDSITGNLLDLPTLAGVCREHAALLYIDDTHGFGVIGERGPDETSPYGSQGNSIVRHFNETYDNIILVAGFSEAYSSPLAFVALPTPLKRHLKQVAAHIYAQPSPTASIATAIAGLDVNEREGDVIRADLHNKTARLLAHVRAARVLTSNTHPCGIPIIELPIAHGDDLPRVARLLWEQGIFVTLAEYPHVARDQTGFRIQANAAHTHGDIDRLIDALTMLTEISVLRSDPHNAELPYT